MSSTTAIAPISRPQSVIGMVHVGAIPGTPHNSETPATLIRNAVGEARQLEEAGFDALILENMHDRPYLLRKVGPETTAVMTAVACAVRDAVTIPFGVQILAGANRAALASAHAAGASFIRAEGFVFASVADEGLLQKADAGPLMRYRRMIGAGHVAVLADIKKKHSAHAVTSDVNLAETAKAAEFFGADGVIVTGSTTGAPASPADVAAAKKAVRIPVLVGSGITPDNLSQYWGVADAFIIGSYLKRGGRWENPLDRERIARIAHAASALRG